MMDKNHTSASGHDHRLPRSVAGCALMAAAFAPVMSASISSRAEMRAPELNRPGKQSFKMHGTDEAVIEIDGYIGGMIDWWTWEEDGKSASTLRSEVKKAGNVKTLRVQLNSEGGKALEGSQMYNVLKSAAKDGIEVIVEVGAACMSAATLVSCAGVQVLTAKNSVWMIHEPATYAEGHANELRAAAEALDTIRDAAVSIYTDFNKSMSKEEVIAVMEKTTYYTGEEALAAGWATGLLNDPASDAVMALDFDHMDLSNASPAAKARLEELKKVWMDAGKPTEVVVEPVVETPPVDVVDATTLAAQVTELNSTVEGLQVVNAELTKRLEAAPKAPTTPAPEMKAPAIDRKNPVVMALGSLAKIDGRVDEFEVALSAGGTVAQLQQRFIEMKAVTAADVTSSGLNADGDIPTATAAEPDPDAIYDQMNGKKK